MSSSAGRTDRHPAGRDRGGGDMPPVWAEELLQELLGDAGLTAIKALVAGMAAPAPAPPPSRNTFRKEGEYWTLRFEGVEARVKEGKGLHVIAYLLSRPGREVHVSDLMAAGGGQLPTRTPPAGYRSEHLHPASGGGEVLVDGRARRAYRSRLLDLHRELEEVEGDNDIERAARVRHEIELITRELTAAYGIGGRARRATDQGERARKAVTERVRRTVDRIDGTLPELGSHLRRSIRTGTFCSYLPAEPVKWEL